MVKVGIGWWMTWTGKHSVAYDYIDKALLFLHSALRLKVNSTQNAF